MKRGRKEGWNAGIIGTKAQYMFVALDRKGDEGGKENRKGSERGSAYVCG